MSKTRFSVNMAMRIAKDESHKDKFTESEIIAKLQSGEAGISGNGSSLFVELKTNNNQIMAQVEELKSA